MFLLYVMKFRLVKVVSTKILLFFSRHNNVLRFYVCGVFAIVH